MVPNTKTVLNPSAANITYWQHPTNRSPVQVSAEVKSYFSARDSNPGPVQYVLHFTEVDYLLYE